jgi:hypothetical protein
LRISANVTVISHCSFIHSRASGSLGQSSEHWSWMPAFAGMTRSWDHIR